MPESAKALVFRVVKEPDGIDRSRLSPTFKAMSDAALQSPEAPTFGITDSAARRIAWVLSQDEHKGMMLRISEIGRAHV